MTHKHFSMSKFVIQLNVARGVFTFVPKVFMVKVHVDRSILQHFKVLENKNEYRKNNNNIFIAPVTIALCKNEL